MPTLTVPYSSLVYDKKTGQYRAPNGQFLPRGEVRRRLDADADATKARLENLAKRAQNGTITVAEWRTEQAREVKHLHLASLAAAKGGFHALAPEDFLIVAREVKKQYRYIERRAQIAAADPDYLASERFVRDASSYGDSGISTFEEARQGEEESRGLIWARNILDDGALHCHPKGDKESCEQQTDKGATESRNIVLVGQRACSIRCRCQVLRFKTEAEAAAYL